VIPEPRPAATVVLLRPGVDGLEALLTHRPASMAFAPDVHVFPGGRVDEADLDPSVQARSVVSPAAASDGLGGDLPPVDALGAYIAAIREAFEEVGILLADVPGSADLADARDRLLRSPSAWRSIVEDFDLRLRTDLLVPLSRWVTPPTLPRRFDTRFFAAAAPDGVDVTLIGGEVAAHAWWPPKTALDAMAEGDLELWVPTSTTLTQLRYVESLDDIRRSLVPGPLGEIEVEDVAADIVRIRMPAGGGVAGQPIDAYLVGRERFVLIDPGDPTGPGLDRAVEEATKRGGSIEAVALTCAEPDHAGGAESIREQLGIEVCVGPYGSNHLPYAVRQLEDGSVLDDGDVPLRLVWTPGLEWATSAFVVGEGRFAVTGDLDGERGARSIFGPIDEERWQASVAHLAEVAPDATWLGGHPVLDSDA
jgi:glyoxylase-like metal-dependent hydrolase (beta-lactamase superfamily II)/8-oxo-dGTP pyrophosphatase MutT (NUDIX family)